MSRTPSIDLPGHDFERFTYDIKQASVSLAGGQTRIAWRPMMNRASTIAVLTLSLVGLGACGAAMSDNVPGPVGSDGGRVDGLAVGAPGDVAAIDALAAGMAFGAAPDHAVDTFNGRNRMHVGTPLSQIK
jgi:hypothetical protein